MEKYLSKAGVVHLIKKSRKIMVFKITSSSVVCGECLHVDTSNSANSATNATNDSAGNPIHSTYLTVSNATITYPQKGETTTSATTAVTSSSCTRNSTSAIHLAMSRKINVTDATESNIGTAEDFDGTGDVIIKLPPTI